MLKQLIQRLLDSRTTPAQAGHSAMPSSAPTTISTPASITSWGTITTFTAPDDGYVTFHGRSMAGAAAQIASLPLENNPTVITATQDNYQGMSCNLPVVKGKTVEVYGSNIENIVVSFNRLIGGGYNVLIWRALSCLRPSFNYLQRSFCKANLIGFQTKPTQSRQQSKFRPLARGIGITSRHLVTDGSAQKALLQNFSLVMVIFGKVFSTSNPTLEDSPCLYQKAKQCLISSQTILRTRKCSLFQAKVPHNLLSMGGALC